MRARSSPLFACSCLQTRLKTSRTWRWPPTSVASRRYVPLCFRAALGRRGTVPHVHVHRLPPPPPFSPQDRPDKVEATHADDPEYLQVRRALPEASPKPFLQLIPHVPFSPHTSVRPLPDDLQFVEKQERPEPKRPSADIGYEPKVRVVARSHVTPTSSPLTPPTPLPVHGGLPCGLRRRSRRSTTATSR